MMMYMPFSGEECADTSLGEMVFDIGFFGGVFSSGFIFEGAEGFLCLGWAGWMGWSVSRVWRRFVCFFNVLFLGRCADGGMEGCWKGIGAERCDGRKGR